ncbi:MAG: AmmeMemoRadiSam system protein A [wastewater metagenome]|nr:AmmeMemoRadiSam system protein A [Candidatus Loosdrechtia aerotolerans]
MRQLSPLDKQAKKILLDIARKSVEAAVKQKPIPDISCNHPDLQGRQGVFVTLKIQGNLRGCIGSFVSDIPLYQLVYDMAVSSAMDDFRFECNRIKSSDLKDLEIEISVLSELRPINDPLDFELGKHGVFIKKDFQTGCFLPQVALETGWSKEEFLSYCCSNKTNLSPNAWKTGDIEIFVFTVEIINEKDVT